MSSRAGSTPAGGAETEARESKRGATRHGRRGVPERRVGDPLVDWFVPAALCVLAPAANGLVALGVSANAITGLSLVLGLGSGLALALGHFALASLSVVVAFIGDALDGLVARRTGTASARGALLDAAVDRYVEFFILGGLAVHFRAERGALLLALLAIHGSFMVSYGSAMAEVHQVAVPGGIMRRPSRAVCLSVGVALVPVAHLLAIQTPFAEAPALLAVAAVGLGANTSAIARLRRLAREVGIRRERAVSKDEAGVRAPRGRSPLMANAHADLAVKPPPRHPEATLPAIFRVALFYGVAGFGGGYSVLAQLRRDLVERRAWLSADEFLELAEISKSLPGTPATSLLALLGQRVGGLRGGVIAAGAFLLPSTVLMIGCGAAYAWMRKASGLSLFFDGMNSAMVGVVAAVTIDLGKSALRSRRDVAFAVACVLLLAFRVVAEPVLACVAALAGAILASWRVRDAATPPSERLHGISPLLPLLLGVGGVGALAGLVRVFVPIGVMTFGGGLAMIPAIEHMVVIEQHWLDPKAFADAIALGQITPGPVAICATFIGYRVAGLLGAIVATVAIFAPAIALALAAGHSVERFRHSPLVAGALRALAPAVIGMLGAATVSLAHAGLDSRLGIGVAALSFVLLLRFPVSPLWALLGGGLVHVVLAR